MPGMSLADAAFNTAHDYPHGGAAALGARMGKSNLSAEVSPARTDAKLGLLDALKLQQLTQDFRILYAMAAETRHYPPLPMPPETQAGDPACMETFGHLAKEFADVAGAFAGALADRQVKDHELAAVQREWSELVACGQQLMQQLVSMNESLRLRRGFAEES